MISVGGDLAPSSEGTEKISRTNFSNDLFRKKFFFKCTKFLMTFFSHRPYFGLCVFWLSEIRYIIIYDIYDPFSFILETGYIAPLQGTTTQRRDNKSCTRHKIFHLQVRLWAPFKPLTLRYKTARTNDFTSKIIGQNFTNA